MRGGLPARSAFSGVREGLASIYRWSLLCAPLLFYALRHWATYLDGSAAGFCAEAGAATTGAITGISPVPGTGAGADGCITVGESSVCRAVFVPAGVGVLTGAGDGITAGAATSVFVVGATGDGISGA